jgi:hypothetical protein
MPAKSRREVLLDHGGITARASWSTTTLDRPIADQDPTDGTYLQYTTAPIFLNMPP